jgi:hypothetical protein
LHVVSNTQQLLAQGGAAGKPRATQVTMPTVEVTSNVHLDAAGKAALAAAITDATASCVRVRSAERDLIMQGSTSSQLTDSGCRISWNQFFGKSVAGQTCVLHGERESSLKFQTRCIACGTDGLGYALGSVEGRVAMEIIDPAPEAQAGKYAFKVGGWGGWGLQRRGQ